MTVWITELLAILVGLGLLALPDACEGPLLLRISQAHAIRLVDAAGLALLVPGALLLTRRAARLLARARPGAALLLEGLLLAGCLNPLAFMKQDFLRFWPVGAALTLACLAWIAWMSRRTCGYGLSDLGLAKHHAGRPVWAFIIAVYLLGLAVELRWPSPVQGEVTRARLLTAAAYSVIYSPLYEELVFRGYLFRRAWGVWSGAIGAGWHRIRLASLFTACLWALNHLPSLALLLALGLTGQQIPEIDWPFAAQVFLVGIIGGELRARTGSIWPGVALHALMNALLVLSLARAFLLRAA
jgi:membrane protease YdiL (CAAX protease family)